MLFNDLYQSSEERRAMEIAMGDPKTKALISANASMYVGGASAFLLTSKNVYLKIGGKVLAGMSGVMAFNSHMLLKDAGEFNPNLFTIEMITVVTHYPPIPLFDFVYDETFVRITDFLTSEPKK